MTKDQEVIYSAFPGIHCGFLDVKVPAKNRRKPFGPWKSWRRLWVSARWESDGGVDLELSRSPDARVTKTVRLPLAANLYRTESRSKLFAFVAVPPERGSAQDNTINSARKPTGDTFKKNAANESACIYLAGRSEEESQRWIDSLRSMLLRATYANNDDTAFTVKFADTAFARKSGLASATGLLTVKRGIGVLVQDISTRVLLASWSCSMITNSHQAGDSMVIIVTTKEFPIGAGQFQLHCSKAALLAGALNSIGHPCVLALNSFGHPSNLTPDSIGNTRNLALTSIRRPNNLALQRGRRLSRSEGDLFLEFQQDHQPPLPSREPLIRAKHSFSPLRLLAGRRRAETMVQSTRSLAWSGSPPTNATRGGKIASSLLSASLGLMLSTPGGSEADDDEDSESGDVEYSDVEDDPLNTTLVSQEDDRRASVSSGIYEEIYENAAAATVMRLEPQPEDPYEDPALLFSPIDWSSNSSQDPPPLPPRHNELSLDDIKRSSPLSINANTEPSDCHYVPMSPTHHLAVPVTESESIYLPMNSPRKFTFLEDTKCVEGMKSCVADRDQEYNCSDGQRCRYRYPFTGTLAQFES